MIKVSDEIKKFLFWGDIHYEDYHKSTLDIVLKFLSDFKPDIYGFGGDQFDMNIVSHWEEGNIRGKEGKRLENIYSGFDNDILKPIEQVLPKNTEKVYMIGNHDDFIEQYLDKNPQIEGLVEPENCLKLKERGWKIVPYGTRNGKPAIYWLSHKLGVIHGWYANKYHSAKTVESAGKSIIYFHSHTFQSYTKESLIDKDDFHTGYGIGCGCNKKPSYGRGRPNRWVNGFVYGYLLPNGQFNVYPVFIIKRKAVINGKLYKV